MSLSLGRRSARRAPAGARRQRGLAALVTVLVLLLLVSLTAGYTVRNLIFEQRTGVNQYRATQALEAADAGQEWVLAQLNGGRIDGACQPSGDPAQRSFRERYIQIAPVGGRITPVVTGPVVNFQDAAPVPACVFDPQDASSAETWWQCECPDGAALGLAAPSTSEVRPAFRVRLQRIRALDLVGGWVERDQPGVLRVEAIACTRLDADCLSFHTATVGLGFDGRAYTSSIVSLAGNVASPPLAPLVARGAVDWPGLVLVNSSAQAGGITLHTGQAPSGVPALNGVSLISIPGTPAETSTVVDLTALGTRTSDALFRSVFRTLPATFEQQPAARRVSGCVGGSCAVQSVRDLLAANPGSPIWVDGNLDIDSPGDVGTPAAPALIVVNGAAGLNIVSSGVTIHGVVYLRAPAGVPNVDWRPDRDFTVRGAVVVDGTVNGSAGATLIYDAPLIERLRVSVGSFVRVPGSWRDTSLQ